MAVPLNAAAQRRRKRLPQYEEIKARALKREQERTARRRKLSGFYWFLENS
jgi:hypothetical protein